MKKTLAFILAAIMVVAVMLTSCTSNGGDDKTTDKTDVTTVADKKDDVTTAEKKDDVTTEGKVDIGGDGDVTTAEEVKETWIVADPTFYDKNGEVIDELSVDSGLDWSIFKWWKGIDDMDIYDSHGAGQSVTATFNGTKVRVWFGNGGPNNHDNILIYIDGELVGTYNGTEEFDGEPWCTAEYKVEKGEHTIKILAGEPNAPENWNGMVFHLVQFVE